MQPDVHIWDRNISRIARVTWSICGNKWLYKTLCGDLVDGSNIVFCDKQPTCMGCILVRFQQKAKEQDG